MKRILHILPSLRRGGTETYVMNNFRKTDREMFNYDFYVLTDKYDQFKDEINELGGSIYYCKVKHFRERYFLSIIQDLRKHIKINGPYSAVHVHINLSNAWFVLGARIAGVKQVISHAHGILTPKDNTISKITVIIKKYINNRFSTIKLACSEEAGLSLYGEKVFQNKGKVVKNGIDVNRFCLPYDIDVKRLKEELNISENSLILGNISRFDENKNQGFIVEIFNQVVKIKPDSVLILGGPDAGKLRNIIDKVDSLNLMDNVRFIGERKDIEVCLKLIDVLVFPSKSEGFGISVIEAQASNVNCVVSDNLSQDTDLGLGLVRYYSLKESANYWASKILGLEVQEKKTTAEIIAAFKVKKLDVESTVAEVESIYNFEKENY